MRRWQELVRSWSIYVFGHRHKEITPKIRVLRVLEEAMELAQSEGVSLEETGIIAAQVYAKPPGQPYQELGGVMVTLAGYADTTGLDLEECFWVEFRRIMDPAVMAKVRHRNLQGDKIGFNKEII